VNGNSNNNGVDMEFVDVDSDPTTFNSSSAGFTLHLGLPCCMRSLPGIGVRDAPGIRYGSTGQRAIQGASSTIYTAITGTLIGEATFSGYPAAFYSSRFDVTAMIQAAGSGTYTVANIQSLTGNSGGGLAAGWSLAIVYKDSTLPLRNLVLYSGLANISSGGSPVSATISGFKTPPSGPTVANHCFVGMRVTGVFQEDSVTFNGSNVSDALNPSNNIMNSTISYLGNYITDKNPQTLRISSGST